MTEQSNAELIAVARSLIDQYDPAFAHVLKQVTDRLEAADRRAEEAERERDRLDEAFDRDLPWRYDEVEAQRNQLAARLEDTEKRAEFHADQEALLRDEEHIEQNSEGNEA